MRFHKTLAGGLLVLIAVGLTGPAFANSLISTSPVAGSTVTTSPSAVTLNVQDPLMDSGSTVTVTDPQGGRVDDGTITVNGATIVAGLKLLTISGVYTVSYSLLTNNDVPLIGTYTITFNAPSVINSPSTPVVTPSTSATPVPASTGIGVPVLIVGLIVAVVAVFLFLVFYAWKLIRRK